MGSLGPRKFLGIDVAELDDSAFQGPIGQHRLYLRGKYGARSEAVVDAEQEAQRPYHCPQISSRHRLIATHDHLLRFIKMPVS
jgi:hypothetical protein